MNEGIPCMWMRGGTSKAAVFLEQDLPSDIQQRNALLLRIMGSPDSTQIDGIGGASPLTSKVGIVKPSTRSGVDIDYLFLQVFVDQALVSDQQGCGNILAAVGPFALERGLLPITHDETSVKIFMENSGEIAEARIQTPDGKVSYQGDASVSGVPGTHAPVDLLFQSGLGGMCGSMLPTGQACNQINGVDVTLIDNGMPCIIIRASDVGVIGTETPSELESNVELKQRLEAIRLQAGPLMNLGDVRESSVPKVTLVSQAREGGIISTRSFIPHRVHKSIGVMAAITVATSCLIQGSVAKDLAGVLVESQNRVSVEHPSGSLEILTSFDQNGELQSAGTIRTARKLFDGLVFV